MTEIDIDIQVGDRTGVALEVALNYYRAWTGGDFERAMTYVSPDIVCEAPAGPVVGAEAFRQFMGPFAGMLTSSRLLAAAGDDRAALLMYDTATTLVADAPGAEWHVVRDGRIVRMRILFDRLPFAAARGAIPADGGPPQG